jgi:molybdenum cofactor guanylyltransferase
MTGFAGAVLTGGASSRLGTDKALLTIDPTLDDRPLAVVAAQALIGAGADPVWCVGGDQAALAALGLDPHPDDHPGEGPLGAILTALRRAPDRVVVVLSCDLPTIDAATVAALVAALDADPAADLAAPVLDGHLQAVTAAYRPSARPALARAYGTGERSVRRAVAGLSRAAVEGLDPDRLADVDRPEDLRRYARDL